MPLDSKGEAGPPNLDPLQRPPDLVRVGVVRGDDVKAALSEAAVLGERRADLSRADDDDAPLLAERPGRLARLMGTEGFTEHPASHHLFLEVPLGTEIKLPPDNFRLQRVAALIARHSDYQALTDLLDQAAAEVRPVIGEVPVRA